MNKYWLTSLTMLALLVPSLAAAEKSPLQTYVDRKDDAFRWVKRGEGSIGATGYVELTLTSQRWKDTLWQHRLFIIRPSTAEKETKHALLVIEGGNWHPRYGRPPERPERLPGEAPLFAAIAEKLGTPVAVLLQVPHQPIFRGKVEDQAIAYTFAQFLKTGDPQWPLLMPMVKSAVAGMDAVQQFAKRNWEMDIEAFTVTGASKRGWTTWLTGAVDERATAIAPMVIDILDLGPQMKHQVDAWGNYSRMIHDYTDLGLQKHLETKAGVALRKIVDPISYRRQLTQPKLIILGTNDDYWPVDALNLYWDQLEGEKYILYVPNNRHGLRDFGRLVGSMHALHQHSNGGPKLPKLTWDFQETGEAVTLRVASSVKPRRVRAWVAHAPERDFRPSRFLSYEAEQNGGDYVYTLPRPKSGFSALFAEAVFDGDSLAYYLSTNVRVVGAE